MSLHKEARRVPLQRDFNAGEINSAQQLKPQASDVLFRPSRAALALLTNTPLQTPFTGGGMWVGPRLSADPVENTGSEAETSQYVAALACPGF